MDVYLGMEKAIPPNMVLLLLLGVSGSLFSKTA